MMVYKSPSAELPADFSGGFSTSDDQKYTGREYFQRLLPDGIQYECHFPEFPADRRELERLSRVWSRTAESALFFPFSFRGLFDRGSCSLHTPDQPAVGINRFTAVPDQKISLTSHRSYDVGEQENREYHECELEYGVRLFGDGE